MRKIYCFLLFIVVVCPALIGRAVSLGEVDDRYLSTYQQPDRIDKHQVDSFIVKTNLKEYERLLIQKKIDSCKVSNKLIADKFEELFSLWHKDIKTDMSIRISSSLETRKKSPYYAKLLAMGKDVLPLTIEKMIARDYFYAIILYDNLQPDPLLRIDLKIRDGVEVLAGEQNRAQRTARLWLNEDNNSFRKLSVE